MIKLFMNEETIGLNTIWYHYKRNVGNPYIYSLSIDLLADSDVIKFIEKFADCSINSNDIGSRILNKDLNLGSMGLIWNLFVIFKKNKKLYKNDVPIVWTLNNIKHVEIADGAFLISGEASVNEGIGPVMDIK